MTRIHTTPSHSNRTMVWCRFLMSRNLATECVIYAECEVIDGYPRGNMRVSRKREGSVLSPIRVLVVEDLRDWRNLVRLVFQIRPEWQVICEVSDGLEAVKKAGELKPDLILLDIGLPKLNGIEAARRIRQLSPSSKIVFLSMDNSLDIVQAALGTGALGYVYKAHAGSELLPAVEAVLRGERFISSGIEGNKLTDTPGANAPCHHEVLFYSDDAVFLESFTRSIAAALKAGNAAIVLATKSHRESLIQRLKAECVDVDRAIQQGTYISSDAANSISTIMVDGLPDPVRYFEGVSCLIEAASKAAKAEHPRVAICGERVGLLWAEGKTDAAIRLEQLGNDLAKTREVNILCAYPLSSIHGREDEHMFQSICAEHSAVYSR
jgi:DNA-binding NarL/FixJ family response regulator